jgi:hypothetical protein
MSTEWDLIAYNRDSQIVLVVEVKSKLGSTSKWVAQLRRNLLAHGNFPNAPYFLMAFPDYFYLWKNIKSAHELIEPTYTIDAHPILQPYFEQSSIESEQVSGESLELIITSWLSKIMHQDSKELDLSQQWLIDSGLYGALVGGSLDRGVFV